MKGPRVSVIMPTYNHARYIGEAIDSVLAQTYREWELVIVDNHSTDGTEAVVASRQDPRIAYFKFANDGIIARSRNAGIRASSGTYVAFLDSDDVWFPEKLERQLAILERDPGLGLCYVLFRHLVDGERDERIRPAEKIRARGSVWREILFRPCIANSGVMVRREVFEELGYLDEDRRLVAAEDSDMWVRIARRSKIEYVDGDPMLLLRIRREGTSLSFSGVGQLKRLARLGRKHTLAAGMPLYAFYVVDLLFRTLKESALRGPLGPFIEALRRSGP